MIHIDRFCSNSIHVQDANLSRCVSLSTKFHSRSSNDLLRLQFTLLKMRPSRLSYVALALCTIIPAMASHLLAREIEGGNRTYGPLPVESYFRKNTAANLLHGHIALMSLSWMCAFPVCKYRKSWPFRNQSTQVYRSCVRYREIKSCVPGSDISFGPKCDWTYFWPGI